MDRGIYPMLSGALAQEERIQVLSGNIANLKTVGFKRVEPVFQAVLAHTGQVSGTWGKGIGSAYPVGGNQTDASGTHIFVQSVSMATNYANGQLKKTENPFDLSIQGRGFFELQTSQGATMYTRNGVFHLDNKKQLVSEDGSLVMGEKGPIKLKKAGDTAIGPDGRVEVDGKTVAKIKLVEFPENKMPIQVGGGLFVGDGAQPAKTTTVLSGHIEESNVNTFAEMVRLVEVMRTYESAQKLLSTYDSTSDTAIQQLGDAKA